MRSRTTRILALLFALVIVLAACGDDDDSSDDGGDDTSEETDETTEDTEEGDASGEGDEVDVVQGEGSTLDDVMAAGTLECGVNGSVPGFSFLEEDGSFSGFDVEFCRAIAAGVLGDADAVNFTPLTAEQRFTALQSGEIDVLVRNTTWTATRDGVEGSSFAATTFYDGQGMMVNSDSGIETVDDLSGGSVCVLSGTTTELNLATRLPDAEALSFADNDTLQEAFIAGQCEGWTSDKSQLAGVRSAWPEDLGGPEALTILEETFSKEPLGPVTRDGDTAWFDAVNWITLSTILAEELGIDSSNVEEMTTSDNADVLRLLGQPSGEDNAVLDAGLGLDPEFVVEVISQVGNYGEIYDATVGPDTPLGLERGLNAQWTDGGLLYSPPYR